MSEIHPDALSLEDAPAGAQLESQPIAQPAEPAAEPEEAALPEGIADPDGRIGPIIAAERRRVREATERRVREQELAPLQQAAQERDQLRAALAEVRPIIDQVRQHGMPKPPEPAPAESRIPDERAERYARRFELYRSDGQPDIGRAKAILAEQQEEISRAAREAAQEIVGPITSQSAQAASRQNLERLALQRDPDGQPVLGRLVDAQTLAQLWAKLPPELTQHPEVAELVFEAAIGQSVRKGGRVSRPERGPIVSEPSGGRSAPAWQPSDSFKKMARDAGLTDKDVAASAKTFNPTGTNVIGE